MLSAALHCQQGRQHQGQHGECHPGVAQGHNKTAGIEQGERHRRQEGDRAALQTSADAVFALKHIGQVIKQAERDAEE